jgi:transcriptional regulator with XRE-family HTH domain
MYHDVQVGMISRLKTLRKALKLTQKEFAEKISLTQSSLSLIESEHWPLTAKNVRLICSEFNVNEAWLRDGIGEMFGVDSPYMKELLEIFSELSPDTQEFLLDMARKLQDKQEMEKKKT